MNVDLANKKILFFGIGFYDYEDAIKHELQNMGASVTYYLDKTLWQRSSVITKISRWLHIDVLKLADAYHSEILNKIDDDSYDYVFVLKGDGLTESFLSELRKRLTNAPFIMYQWDSLARVPNAVRFFQYFDKIFSFDRIDCLNDKRLNFRPLFFRESNEKINYSKKYDMAFIGWLNAERLPIIERVNQWSKSNKLKSFFYLSTGLKTYLINVIKNKSEFIYFRKISYKRVCEISSITNVILDFPHPQQSGLTMRTIEAVGMKKKLITTNRDILNYDFFNKNNILIINDGLDGLSKSFFDFPCVDISEMIIEKYKLSSWVHEVFSI